MADLFQTAGADRIMAIDLHTSQIQGFFNGPVDHLWAMPMLAQYVRTRVAPDNLTIVSPDAGRVRLEIAGAEKTSITVPDPIGHFSVKTDRMFLAS